MSANLQLERSRHVSVPILTNGQQTPQFQGQLGCGEHFLYTKLALLETNHVQGEFQEYPNFKKSKFSLRFLYLGIMALQA